jgi:hypothetical protein
MRVLQTLCVIVFCLSLPQSVNAWSPIGATWPSLPVPYNVNVASSQELGHDVSISVIQDSYESWTSPPCSAYRVQYRGTTSQTWTSGDGVNTHQWVYSSNQRPAELGGRETIGVTLSLYRGTELIDGDIIYNGIDHQWTTRATRAGEVDAQSIITHEVGHQLGLGHSNSNGATMYPSYGGGEGPRSLHQDDIEGVCTLYPNNVSAQCMNASECGEGQECVQSQCINIASEDGQIGDDCGFAPCTADLICVQAQDNSAFCTRICSDGLCPGGWGCYTVNSSQGEVNLCLPAQSDQGDLAFGEACESGPQCTSGLCVSDDQSSFCSQSCTEDAGCPYQAQCVGLSNGGGACVPNPDLSGMSEFGTSCTQSSDCPNGLCLDDDIELYCTFTCESDRDCPSSAACFNASEFNVCVKVDQTEPQAGTEAGTEAGAEAGAESGAEAGAEMMSTGMPYGDPCETAIQCIDGLCLSDGMSQFCSAYCEDPQDCPNGDICVGIGNDEGGCLPNTSSEATGGSMSPNNSEMNDNGLEDDPQAIKDTIGCASHHRPNAMIWFLLFTVCLQSLKSRAQRLR